ncbi:hypothetical protein VULLAG_LOCUS22433 [Vulpes lagopus]
MPCVSRLPRSQSKVTFQARPSGEPEAPELSTVQPSTPAQCPCSGCRASPCPRAHQCVPADPSRGARGPVGAGEAQGRTPACPSQHALSPGLPVRPCTPRTPAPSSTEPLFRGSLPTGALSGPGRKGRGAQSWPLPGLPQGLASSGGPAMAGRLLSSPSRVFLCLLRPQLRPLGAPAPRQRARRTAMQRLQGPC